MSQERKKCQCFAGLCTTLESQQTQKHSTSTWSSEAEPSTYSNCGQNCKQSSSFGTSWTCQWIWSKISVQSPFITRILTCKINSGNGKIVLNNFSGLTGHYNVCVCVFVCVLVLAHLQTSGIIPVSKSDTRQLLCMFGITRGEEY